MQTELALMLRTAQPDFSVDAFSARYQERLHHYYEHPLVQMALERMSAVSKSHHNIFTYHNSAHVRNVLNDSILLLSLAEVLGSNNIPEKHFRNLAIAAAYHDTGFTTINLKEGIGPKDHEARSVEMFLGDCKKISAELEEEDITMIREAIMATQLQFVDGAARQITHSDNVISSYLQDADLGNFGQASFLSSLKRVHKENLHVAAYQARKEGKPRPEGREEYYAFLLGTRDKLFHPQEWKTNVAQLIWTQGKIQNAKELDNEIELTAFLIQIDKDNIPTKGTRRKNK